MQKPDATPAQEPSNGPKVELVELKSKDGQQVLIASEHRIRNVCDAFKSVILDDGRVVAINQLRKPGLTKPLGYIPRFEFVEVKTNDAPVTWTLAQVTGFKNRKIVVRYFKDDSDDIVFKSVCRFPNYQPILQSIQDFVPNLHRVMSRDDRSTPSDPVVSSQSSSEADSIFSHEDTEPTDELFKARADQFLARNQELWSELHLAKEELNAAASRRDELAKELHALNTQVTFLSGKFAAAELKLNHEIRLHEFITRHVKAQRNVLRCFKCQSCTQSVKDLILCPFGHSICLKCFQVLNNKICNTCGNLFLPHPVKETSYPSLGTSVHALGGPVCPLLAPVTLPWMPQYQALKQ